MAARRGPGGRVGSPLVVLGPDGEPEFRVPAPTGVTFEAALGELVWGTGLTELDIPYIVQLELRPPGACR